MDALSTWAGLWSDVVGMRAGYVQKDVTVVTARGITGKHKQAPSHPVPAPRPGPTRPGPLNLKA